jgi:hypothetical protein
MFSHRLNEKLKTTYSETGIEEKWRRYVREKKPGGELNEEDWEDAYLPSDKEERAEFAIPSAPLVVEFPNITRRVAAQRSRFVAFGTDWQFLAHEFKRQQDPLIRRIAIAGNCRRSIRHEVRESGITESVIYPDLDGVGREMQQLWQERK